MSDGWCNRSPRWSAARTWLARKCARFRAELRQPPRPWYSTSSCLPRRHRLRSERHHHHQRHHRRRRRHRLLSLCLLSWPMSCFVLWCSACPVWIVWLRTSRPRHALWLCATRIVVWGSQRWLFASCRSLRSPSATARRSPPAASTARPRRRVCCPLSCWRRSSSAWPTSMECWDRLCRAGRRCRPSCLNSRCLHCRPTQLDSNYFRCPNLKQIVVYIIYMIDFCRNQ